MGGRVSEARTRSEAAWVDGSATAPALRQPYREGEVDGVDPFGGGGVACRALGEVVAEDIPATWHPREVRRACHVATKGSALGKVVAENYS